MRRFSLARAGFARTCRLRLLELYGIVYSHNHEMSKHKSNEKNSRIVNLESDVAELFEKAQKSQALHFDCSKKLQKLIDVERTQFRCAVLSAMFSSGPYV